ncbi:uncharacterized protein GGS22DRAFT_136184 [Annulohypoxylon maeteangense]|uniref:uncharacterized protein n=1 Tax=Annulohypoxylon maeteangense TaxID=1927788 RepID=UPI00200834D1|nr:uncharacterized protein GGS22DRAFT_136184 [Annulohypoxylon maeteangense]KAI0884947.1 hypothetical protein GGS22DRAFT_136184 [Annulohypoxylon maeteangense]
MGNCNILFTALLTALCVVAQTLPPSPTASVGCHAHEDHWHCDGPVSTAASLAASTQTPASNSTTSPITSSTSEEHEKGTGSLAPSPTESFGCEPHGDHWHCDGAVVASSTSTAQPAVTAGIGKVEIDNAAIIGGLLVVAGMGL